MKNILTMTLGFLLINTIFCSCKKFVEIDSPGTSVTSVNIYNNNATAIGAVTSLYIRLSSGSLTIPGELTSLSSIAGLSADELVYYNGGGQDILAAYYQNSLTSMNSGATSDYWSAIYKDIFMVNSALEGLTISSGLTPSVKQQLIGEAKFMRALYYFYLVNLYGNVPLVLTTDYTTNALITRSPSDQLYKQIIIDLEDAKEVLNDKYVRNDGITTYSDGAEERVRPNKWAAVALLARVYLYLGDWMKADLESSEILLNSSMYGLTGLDNVFLKNNKEAIWQLQATSNGVNTLDGNTFILPEMGPSVFNPVYLSPDLVDDFEIGDKRKANWIDSVESDGNTYFFSYKYKIVNGENIPVTEYSTVMRIGEQYLIRAEARAHLNNLEGAIADIDHIRQRAGLPLIKNVNPGILQEELLTKILLERRHELFTEWGHRWFDLKRTAKIDQVMKVVVPLKSNGLQWDTNQKYYPISLTELQANPNLIQNPGY